MDEVHKATELSSVQSDELLKATQRTQRYGFVFSNEFATKRITRNSEETRNSEKTRNSEVHLDPETLYYYNQRNDFKSILWMDKFSRVFYLFSYFLFLVLYWTMYNH